MDPVWAALGAALALGALHALEVDHMVAVTAFVGRRPHTGAAIAYGLRWGLGHALVVLVAGGVLAASGLTLPPAAARWAESGVGVVLILLGAWAVRGARRLHVHTPDAAEDHHGTHVHLHRHAPGRHPHHHGGDDEGHHHHVPTWIGAAHGLAGTGAVVALLPLTVIERPAVAIGYLAAFGVGTMLAMAAYAVLAAWAVRQAARSARAARLAARVTGVASVAVGVWWIVRAC